MLPGRQVVQPANRGTAAAILYAVLTVRNLAGDVPVAVFPTDHEVSDDRAFMRHVQHAIEAARLFPEHVVVLGIQPSRAEPEYGWIQPAPKPLPVNGTAVHRIHRFWEKPGAGTGWCDLGSPARVLDCLRRTGRLPDWLAETELAPGA